MNSLIIFKEEVLSDSKVVLTGGRADSVVAAHDLVPGIRIAASVLGGKRGSVTVESVEPGRVCMVCFFDREPLPRENTEFVVAVPRPQTVKKVLAFAAVSGILRVHFIKTANVEKSYLQSRTLKQENIQRELILGAEQAFDSILPEVMIHPSFNRFVSGLNDYFPGVRTRILASTPGHFIDHGQVQSMAGLSLENGDQPVVLAIGPERGWTGEEVRRFVECGFTGVGLGERIFRVEQAVSVLAGQTALLREQARVRKN